MLIKQCLKVYAIPIWPSLALLAKYPRTGSELRLIKTSEADPGTWVTEEEKIDHYVASGIRFIDITDITVSTSSPSLQLLSHSS